MNQPQQPRGPRKLGSKIIGGFVLCTSLAVLVTVTTTGCSYYGHAFNSAASPYDAIRCEAISEFRARIRARSLWASKYETCYRHHGNRKDVRAGFIDGFIEVCLGGSGRTPLFAPNGGSSLALRDRCAAAWFEGYPLGVAAAESCGCGHQLRNQRVNPGLLACGEPACNPGCVPCPPGASDCRACGQPAAKCGCLPVSPRVPSSQSTYEHAVGDRPRAQDTVSPELPQVGPGETIVPGSIEMHFNDLIPIPIDLQEDGDASTIAPPALDPELSAAITAAIEQAIPARTVSLSMLGDEGSVVTTSGATEIENQIKPATITPLFKAP